MALPKLTKPELQIMDALWRRGPCSVREIQESFPARKRPAYTTVQTMVSREAAERRWIDDLLGLFGGRSRPIVAHLIESGTLTLEDVQAAEQTLLKLAREDKPE